MKRFFILLLLIAITTIPVLSTEQDDDTAWEKVGDNSYLNLDGVMGTEDIYGFSFVLKSFNKGQYEPIYGKSIKYTLSNYTIDCAKHKYKIGIIDSYGDKDNFINGDYNKYATFQPIVEGTAVGEVAKILCRIY